MKRMVPALLATTLLAACGTVADVVTKTGRVLMDPSIPIGPPDEQLSLIGLSLYAAADVNPNPASMPDEEPESAAAPSNREAGPYEVKLNSGNREELIEHLRGLLDELEEGRPSLHPLRRVDTGPSTIQRMPGEAAADPGAADAVAKLDLLLAIGVSEHFVPGRQFGSGKQVIEQGFSGVPLPLGGLAGRGPQGTGGSERQGGSERLGGQGGMKMPSASGDFSGAGESSASGDLSGAGESSGAGKSSGAGESSEAIGLGLGQYSRAHSMPTMEPTPAPRGAPTPIAFKVLQLKDDSLLLNTDPDQLARDLKKALGSTYVVEDDYVLQPGQFKFIDFVRIEPATRYVAIIADFHDPNGAVWKHAFRLEPTGRRYALLMTLHGNRVAITDESYRPPQPRSQP